MGGVSTFKCSLTPAVIKDLPSLAKRSVFVDPVVFCLWEGDVCYNFCYREPKTVSFRCCIVETYTRPSSYCCTTLSLQRSASPTTSRGYALASDAS